MILLKILHVLVIVFCFGVGWGAPIQGHVDPLLTTIEHTADFTQLFGTSKVTDEVFGRVTRFMDNEAKTDFLKLFPEAKSGLSGVDHRVVGHVLDGGYIRKEVVDRILEKCPGLTREEVLRRLVKHNEESLEKLVNDIHGTYGIPIREAKALIRIDAGTHLLGDTSTSVKTIGQIPTPKRIISIFERNLSKFIGKQKAAQLAKQCRKVVAENKSLDNKELYKLVKKTIAESGVGEEFQRAIAKLTKDAAVQQEPIAFVANEHGLNPQGANQIVRGSMTSARSESVVAGRSRDVMVKGRRKKVVDIPVIREDGRLSLLTGLGSRNPQRVRILKNISSTTVESGTKATVVNTSGKISKWLASPAGQGVAAGVLSFAIAEGGTVISYAEGDMESDEFLRKTALNSGVAAVEGGVGYLIVGTMAGAPAAVVVGTLVVSGIVINQAGQYIWYRIDKEYGSLGGITVDELFFEVREDVRNRRTALDDLEDFSRGCRPLPYVPYSH